MKLIKQRIERDGSGTVTLLPEEAEDMWHAYNLIRVNDLLRASAVRRVTTESATGSTSSQRVHTTFLITVTSIDFDPQAGQLHVGGRVSEENKYVKIGQHHTLDLELNRNFTLEKSEGWDSVALGMVREACNPENRASLAAVVMQEGLANICLITEHQTILRQRVETSIARKRQGKSNDHDKSLSRFFQITLETLLRNVDLSEPKPILLASPGFVASSFHSYILSVVASPPSALSTADHKILVSNRDSFIVAHSSSGHLHTLSEVLASKSVLAKLSNTKFARETAAMDKFFELLRRDDGRAWYGPREVEKAVEQGAVGRGGGILLISNDLFRSQQVDSRKRWVAVVESVKKDGGDVRILSSDHESGRRLENLGQIAAILTYPIPDLDEAVEEDITGTSPQPAP